VVRAAAWCLLIVFLYARRMICGGYNVRRSLFSLWGIVGCFFAIKDKILDN